MSGMNVTIKDGIITITAPISANPQLSSTGKSLVLFSSQGFVKPPGLMHEGKQVSVGINVIAALKTSPAAYQQ